MNNRWPRSFDGGWFVGFDGTPDAVAAVKSGALYATITQRPALIGSLGVETADKVVKGQSVPASTPVPLTVIGHE